MEPPFLGAEQELNVGTETVIESDSPDETRGVVFEDDGETGYFYARDYSMPEHYFVDALHIYNSQGVTDRDKRNRRYPQRAFRPVGLQNPRPSPR